MNIPYNILVAGLSYASAIAFSLAISVLLSRLLGPKDFGAYITVISVVSVLCIPAFGGSIQLITRETSKYIQRRDWGLYRGLLLASHGWIALTTFVVAILLFTSLSQVEVLLGTEVTSLLTKFAISVIALQGLSSIHSGFLKGQGHPALAEIPMQVFSPAVYLTYIGYFLLNGTVDTETILWGYVLGNFCGLSLLLCLRYRLKITTAIRGYTSFDNRGWLTSLMPLIFIFGLGTFGSQLGVLYLGFSGAHESVAGLRVGERLAQFIGFTLVVVNMVIGPTVTRLQADGNTEALQKLSSLTARVGSGCSVLLFIIFVAYGQDIIELTFGEEFVGVAYMPMVILMLGQLVNVAYGSVALILNMSGYERHSLVAQAFGLLVTVIACLAIGSAYGAVGTAVSIALGITAWNVMAGFFVHKKLGLRPGIF